VGLIKCIARSAALGLPTDTQITTQEESASPLLSSPLLSSPYDPSISSPPNSPPSSIHPLDMEDLQCHEALGCVEEKTRRTAGVYRDSGHGSLSPGPPSLQPLFCLAYKDPVLVEDTRVFRNMLEIEEFYCAATNYFQMVQHEIRPNMRQIVTDWMLEVCFDQNCHANVFLLSTNIMDRFLSQLGIKKSQFQLVAAATVFIASKLVDPCPIPGSDLVRYTDDTYTLTELLEMELLILSKLKWDLSAVTPYDFLEHLLRLLQEEDPVIQEEQFRKNTERIIINCAKEFRFSMYTPSMLSSAAIATAAALGLSTDSNFDITELINRLQFLTRVENDCLTNCIHEMHEIIQRGGGGGGGGGGRPGVDRRDQDQSNSPQHSIPDSSLSSKTTTSSTKDQTHDRQSPDELKSHTPTEVFSVDYLYVT